MKGISKSGLRVVLLIALTLLCSGLLPAASQATLGKPTDALRLTLDKVFDVLKDPALSGEANRETQIAMLREVMLGYFDMEELSRRTLAVHWPKFSPEQRKEFQALFSKLLENTYVDRIRGYTDETVTYGEEVIEADRAVVKTKLNHKGRQIPMDYALHVKDGQWRVFDVQVEGVSLVRNYRSQFQDILSKDGPEQLLVKLRERTKDPSAK